MKTFSEFLSEGNPKAGSTAMKDGSEYYLSDMGTYVKVTAKFTDDAKANAYMEKNSKEGALGMDVKGKTVYIGDMKDKGISIKNFNK